MTRSSGPPSDRADAATSDEIEFLAPRADLFGAGDDDVTSTAPDAPGAVAFGDLVDAPRSRAATVLAALGLTGLIAVGVIAAAPWSSDPAASPSTTVPRPITSTSVVDDVTSVAPTADVDTSVVTEVGAPDLSPSGPGYLIVRPPTGMTASGAYDQGSGGAATAHLDIWATPDADRTTGTWLAVASTSFADGSLDVIADATPVQVGDVTGLIAMDRDDVVVLTWRPGQNERISLAAHGFALDRLLAIAASISLVLEDRPTYLSPPTADDGSPLTRVVDTATDTADLAGEVAQLSERIAFYENATGTTSIVIGTRSVRETDTTIARFLLASATGPDGATVDRLVTVNGLDVAVGSLPLSPRVSAVQWQVDDQWITVIGTVPVDRLIRSLRTARLATADEWDALVAQALDPNQSTDSAPAFATIGAGSGNGTNGWGAALSQASGYFLLRGADFYYSENVEPDPLVPTRTFRTTSATFVLALVDAPPAGSTLTVTPAGGEPVVVPFVSVPGGTWAGAVASFAGGGEFTATIDVTATNGTGA